MRSLPIQEYGSVSHGSHVGSGGLEVCPPEGLNFGMLVGADVGVGSCAGDPHLHAVECRETTGDAFGLDEPFDGGGATFTARLPLGNLGRVRARGVWDWIRT
ncbi:MAG: hypothetical protein ACI80V_002875 [Rhodothermales bacterium]|jgi:hypothetical protein